jgi:hypothetical protein
VGTYGQSLNETVTRPPSACGSIKRSRGIKQKIPENFLRRKMIVGFLLLLIQFVGYASAGWYSTNIYSDSKCSNLKSSLGQTTDTCYLGAFKYTCKSGMFRSALLSNTN